MIHNHETSKKWLVMIGAGESSIGKVTEEMLREAARQAKETGRTVTVTLPNGIPLFIS